MLTHIDSKNQPTMVDVSEKASSVRMATAQATVRLPEALRPYFKDGDFLLKKGPVFHTAIIAGTMAVKKTHELIPFCHQIPVESCKIEMDLNESLEVTISCRVRTTYKTGVEMEALHGAMTAALTVYDMVKAVSHDVVIAETKLIAKTGGKRTFLNRPTYGLVLTGGKSERMRSDKALLSYKGKPHALHIHDILARYCDQVYLSARPGQWKGTELEPLKTISDLPEFSGPIGGLLSAFSSAPEANWIVVACDLVHFNETTVETLLASVTGKTPVTCFKNSEKGFPEPLCAFYAPEAREIFLDAFRSDVRCPVKVLRNIRCDLIDQGPGIDLANINTREELQEITRALH